MVKGWEPSACSLRRNRFFACLPPQHCYSHGELQLLMQYLVSCMTEFLFPLGERSIFLQEHTQIRISSKHTLPVRHSCEAVKWHFHLWNGGGFLTAQQNLIVVRFFSPLLLHLVLFFPTVLWLPELAFSSPAFSDFFFFPAPLWREISILKLWVHAWHQFESQRKDEKEALLEVGSLHWEQWRFTSRPCRVCWVWETSKKEEHLVYMKLRKMLL